MEVAERQARALEQHGRRSPAPELSPILLRPSDKAEPTLQGPVFPTEGCSPLINADVLKPASERSGLSHWSDLSTAPDTGELADTLLRAHLLPTGELVLALSCIAALATSQASPSTLAAVPNATTDWAVSRAPGAGQAVTETGAQPWSAREGAPRPCPDQPTHAGAGTSNSLDATRAHDSRLAHSAAARGGHADARGCSPAPPPPPPLRVLPLVPLLAAVACGDLAKVESSLRRLNRRLGRPLSSATDGSGGATCSRGLRGSLDGNGGSAANSATAKSLSDSCASSLLAALQDGSASVCLTGSYAGSGGSIGGGSCAVGSACSSSLRAARQAEAQVANEHGECRAAAARLCGRGSTRLCAAASAAASMAGIVEALEAEAEAVRGACVAALAAAAADVRCHQALLGSGTLDALPRLLRGPATAPYAVVLVHNLAAPPSAAFRDQLRRRGALAALLDHLPRLGMPGCSTPPSAAVRHGVEGSATGVDPGGLEVALTALTCLSAGQEGSEALQQPHLRARKKLLALWEHLQTWRKGPDGPAWPSLNHGISQHSCGDRKEGMAGMARDQSRAAEADERAALVVGRLRALLQGLLHAAGAAAAAAAEWDGCARTPRRVEPPAPAPSKAAAPQCGGAVSLAVNHGASPASAVGCEGNDASSVSFQGQVMVGGRPLQLTSVITRTAVRRPDGSLDVQYHFQDQVLPGGGASEGVQACTPVVGGAHGPLATHSNCFSPPASWLHTAVTLRDEHQQHDQDQPRREEKYGMDLAARCDRDDDQGPGDAPPASEREPAKPGGSAGGATQRTPRQTLPSDLAALAERAGRFLSTASKQRLPVKQRGPAS